MFRFLSRLLSYRFYPAVFAVFVSVIVSAISIYGYFSPVDHAVYDTLMNIREKQVHTLPPGHTVLVTIDQASEDHLGMRISNFTRSMLARAVENLHSSGAALIGIDLDLSKSQDASDDYALAASIKNSGNVVLASYVSGSRLIQPLESFLSGANGEGLINLKIDRDGILRGTYVVIKTDKGFYLSLPVYLAAKYRDNRTPQVRFGNGTVIINNTTLPVYHGEMLINYTYAGPFESIPYYKVLDNSYNHNSVKGRIVLIGNTSPLYHDYTGIPLKSHSGRKTFYGIEVFASAVDTVLNGAFIKYMYNKPVLFIIGILIVISGVILSLIKKPNPKILVMAGIVAAAVLIQWLMFVQGAFVPASVLYVSVPVIAFYSIGYDYMSEYRIRRHVSEAFAHYVSKELLSEIMHNPGSLRLGGERRNITVLFSDIRDFTSIAEHVSPEKLVEFLHVFFNAMTSVIHSHHGVVDKFIGDAIMAIFGAPVPSNDHARNAVSSGIGMMKALTELGRHSERILGTGIGIGIGIHTGEAIVGNMGSDKRFDYTAIGDTVNIASRLEGANKFFGSTCILSESTMQMLKNDVRARQLGIVRVKGKSEGIMLYELTDGSDNGFTQKYNEAWEYINKNSLERARAILVKLLDQRPKDKPCRILLDKVAHAVSTSSHFDPVIEMREK